MTAKREKANKCNCLVCIVILATGGQWSLSISCRIPRRRTGFNFLVFLHSLHPKSCDFSETGLLLSAFRSRYISSISPLLSITRFFFIYACAWWYIYVSIPRVRGLWRKDAEYVFSATIVSQLAYFFRWVFTMEIKNSRL